ncbi:aldose epimerase family protein [Salininema proteolyticum]|uniref:Aldose epimerase n=1 Tax=Salininema proteolyticum TaxID=1607685 RepID=A0ABV8TWI7_9ACTN
MALSGRTWIISYGGHEASIASVGGGLRNYQINGTDVIDGYSDEEIAPEAAGHLLAPWPGRIAGGRYGFGGGEHFLPINDPSHNAALHGLVQWCEWEATEVTSSAVTVEYGMPARPGYPWPLTLRTRWSVGPMGLRAAHTVSNIGSETVPFGFGVHPYVKVPDAELIDSGWVEMDASEQCVLDRDLIPSGFKDSEVKGRTDLAGLVLDNAYTGLERDSSGTSTVRVGNGGKSVEVWADDSFDWFVLFTSDTRSGERRRGSIAVEPMTCPPNAFNDGRGLIELGPSQAWFGVWGVKPVGFD